MLKVYDHTQIVYLPNFLNSVIKSPNLLSAHLKTRHPPLVDMLFICCVNCWKLTHSAHFMAGR